MSKRKYWTGDKRAPAQDKFFAGALDPDLWTPGDETDWDACWQTGMPKRNVFRSMRAGQWINHIPGNHALTVKSRLHETLEAARARAPQELQDRFNFFPRSYLMPDDYHALQRDAFAEPERRWIFKPKSLSRGRGIFVADDAALAPNDEKMLAQAYLNRPHLYDGRKYVLRCYLAIMSAEPLRVYLYKEGFVKLASEPFRDDDFDNLYAHLTNPDVNALNETVEDSVVFHSFAAYRDWLRAQGADPKPLFKALRDIGVIISIAARDALRARLAAMRAYAPGCCELIGMDCMIDADLKPWLLECNLSPSLGVCAAPETGGLVEEEIKRNVVADFVAMAGLNDPDRIVPDPDDIRALVSQSEREGAAAGGYERIYPGADARAYFPFFPAPRYADIALAEAVAAGASAGYAFAANSVGEFAFDDKVALHDGTSAEIMTPSSAGAYIWLRAAGGDAPAEIASDLAAIAGDDKASDGAAKTVWDTLADWGAAGFLRAEGMNAPPSLPARDTFAPAGWALEETIDFAGAPYRIRLAAPELAPRVGPLLVPMRRDGPAPVNPIEIQVLRERAGYAIAIGASLAKTSLRLAEVAFALAAVLKSDAAARLGAPLLNASLWRMGEASVLLASSPRTHWDALGALMAEAGAAHLVAGAVLLGEAPGTARPLALPGRAPLGETLPRPKPINLWAEDGRGAVIALAAPPPDHLTVDAVLFPGADMAVISGRRALRALIGLVDGERLSSAGAAALAQWADVVACAPVPVARPDIDAIAAEISDRIAAAASEIKSGAPEEAPLSNDQTI